MTIQERIELTIDSIQDGVNFRMLLFNEGKYNREQLRTIIRNVGLRLTIENNLENKITIDSLYFGIFNDQKLSKLYSSFGLSSKLPLDLDSDEKFSINFYGNEVKERFEQYKNETGMFIISTLDRVDTFHSSKFKGDDIEKKIKYLEDGEEANWGSNEYCSFDVETTF